MVVANMGLPDPYDPNTSLSSSNDLIMHNDHHDLDEDVEDRYEGYQQLNGQDNIPDSSDSESDDDSNDANVQAMDTSADVQEGLSDLPAIENVENALLKEVWAETQSKDIEMSSDKVQAVKEAMLNFTLPSSSIPDWATNIPEQDWKDHMLQKIQSKVNK